MIKKKNKLNYSDLETGALLITCNFSFQADQTDEINKIKEAAVLNNLNLSDDKANFGSAAFKYVGEEYYNGDVFVGINEKINKTLFKFKSRIGSEVLLQMIKDKLVQDVLLKSTVSQIAFAFQIEPYSEETLESWIEKSQLFSRQKKKFKGVVFLDENCLNIGQKSSGRSLSIEPIIKRNSETISKFVITCQVQSKPASELWDIFLGGSSKLDNYFAVSVYEIFELFEKTPFVEKFQNNLAKNFDISSVKKITRDTAKKLPAYRSVRTSCTTLTNKLLNKTFSLGTQEIILNSLKEVVNGKKEIDNFNEFRSNILKILGNESAS